MANDKLQELYQQTLVRLLQVNRRFQLLQLLRSSLHFSLILILILIIFSILEIVFEFNTAVRLFFLGIVALSAVIFFGKFVLPGLRRAYFPSRAELDDTARKIGQTNPEIKDAIVDFLQIYRDEGISTHPTIKQLSLQQLFYRFRDHNFQNVINFSILKLPARRLLVGIFTLIFLFIIFPQGMNTALLKMIYPFRSFEKPFPIKLHNLTGDLQILKNDTAVLKGEFEGIVPHQLWVEIKPVKTAGQVTGEDTVTVDRIELPIPSKHQFEYSLTNVKSDFRYWFVATVDIAAFRGRAAYSEVGLVSVVERPFIRELQVKLSPPAYTGLEPVLLPPNEGEIRALKGTKVSVNITANKKLSAAYILFQDSSRVPMKVLENRAQGEFTVLSNNHYQVIILDEDSIPNFKPVEYFVFALEDEYPFVTIEKPGEDIELGDELAVPILINAQDDFGFTALQLKGQFIHAGSTGDTTDFSFDLPLQYITRNRAISQFLWDLTSFMMVPEDYLQYYAEVKDNDRITGPKVARSKTFVIRLPSLLEILEQSEETVSEELQGTQDVAAQSKELKEKLEEIHREMKREQELTWERRKEIEEQLQQQKEALDKLEDIQKKLEDVINKLEDQNVLSPETLEKYFELQKMFQELATPELMEAMKKLQEAIEKADLQEVKKALEEFKLNVEQFEQSVERTYELFKQVQMEQKMDELVHLAEKLAEEQQKVNEELAKDDLSENQLNQLANKEGSLEKQTEFLKNKIQETASEMQQWNPQTAQDLATSEQFMEEQELIPQMQTMQQSMRQGNRQDARQRGEKLKSQLDMLQSMLQQAQQNMMEMQKQEILTEMQKVVQDLLSSSFQEEQLLKQSERLDMASPRISEIARKQAQMRENTIHIIKRMIDISKKTFFISPNLNQTMAAVMQQMEKSLQALENRNPRGAAQSQRKVMANLNMAILSMQNSMNQLMQANSASGFEQFMQQLQQMAGQQGQLNQQTLSLFQQQGQGRLQLSEGDLARLAAQQEMIRRSLEKLTEQMGHRGDVLGRLGELGQEMQEVIDKLKSQQLDRQVIERQERILSRLLDAQRSIREKEFSKKRQAERGEVSIVKSPPELQQEIFQQKDLLRKEMLEALQEGYSTEYKDFIKLYYEILSRQPQK